MPALVFKACLLTYSSKTVKRPVVILCWLLFVCFGLNRFLIILCFQSCFAQASVSGFGSEFLRITHTQNQFCKSLRDYGIIQAQTTPCGWVRLRSDRVSTTNQPL